MMVSRCLHGPTEEWTMSVLQRTCGCCLAAKLCLTICNPKEPARLLCPCDSTGKNTGVTCHFLLQGIFLIQGENMCLLHWQVDSLQLKHQGSHTAKEGPSQRSYFLYLADRVMAVQENQALHLRTHSSRA